MSIDPATLPERHKARKHFADSTMQYDRHSLFHTR